MYILNEEDRWKGKGWGREERKEREVRTCEAH
jgi:hypothetical protein